MIYYTSSKDFSVVYLRQHFLDPRPQNHGTIQIKASKSLETWSQLINKISIHFIEFKFKCGNVNFNEFRTRLEHECKISKCQMICKWSQFFQAFHWTNNFDERRNIRKIRFKSFKFLSVLKISFLCQPFQNFDKALITLIINFQRSVKIHNSVSQAFWEVFCWRHRQTEIGQLHDGIDLDATTARPGWFQRSPARCS